MKKQDGRTPSRRRRIHPNVSPAFQSPLDREHWKEGVRNRCFLRLKLNREKVLNQARQRLSSSSDPNRNSGNHYLGGSGNENKNENGSTTQTNSTLTNANVIDQDFLSSSSNSSLLRSANIIEDQVQETAVVNDMDMRIEARSLVKSYLEEEREFLRGKIQSNDIDVTYTSSSLSENLEEEDNGLLFPHDADIDIDTDTDIDTDIDIERKRKRKRGKDESLFIAEDDEDLLNYLDEILEEELQEEEKRLTEEYDEYRKTILSHDVGLEEDLISAFENMEFCKPSTLKEEELVICPICHDRYLLQTDGNKSIFCPGNSCNLRLPFQKQDGLTLAYLKERLFTLTEVHKQKCQKQAEISLVEDFSTLLFPEPEVDEYNVNHNPGQSSSSVDQNLATMRKRERENMKNDFFPSFLLLSCDECGSYEVVV